MPECRRQTRRSPMLERYVSRELAGPFLGCLLGLLSLFLVADALDAQQDLADAGATARETLLYFCYRQPLNLVHVLPMAVLLATSYTICTLGRRNEITAMRSSGISLLHWGRPFWILGLGATLLTLTMAEFAAPRVAAPRRAIRERKAARDKPQESIRTLLAYRNPQANRDWFFEEFSDKGTGKNVLVKQFRSDGSLLWELQAARARYRGTAWQFSDASLAEYAVRDGFPEIVRHRRFEQYTAETLSESPRRITGTLRPEKDLAAGRMLRILWTSPSLPGRTRSVLATAVWYHLSYPFSCLMCALVGVALNVRSERAGALGGFAAAVGIIFLYYLVSQFVLLLGRTGRLPPAAAGVLPILLFLIWAVQRVHTHR